MTPRRLIHSTGNGQGREGKRSQVFELEHLGVDPGPGLAVQSHGECGKKSTKRSSSKGTQKVALENASKVLIRFLAHTKGSLIVRE